MKSEIKIPAMGESVSEATIGRFLKPDGSLVKENDEIVELETEKVNQVLYSPTTGKLIWNVKEGDVVRIGDVIGAVDTEAVAQKQKESPKPKEEKKPLKQEIPKPSEKKEIGIRKGQEEFIKELKQQEEPTPAPKKMDKALPKEERKGETRRPMSSIRKTIAARLVDSLHQAAMLTTFNEVDMTAIGEIRERHKASFLEKHGVKLGLMSFFVKAVVNALHASPDLNSYIDGDDIVTRHSYDIGIAVGTDRGLVVPVVRACETLSFAQIEQAIDTYAKKARGSKLIIDDLRGGGFTITNGGVYGSLLSTPILNPPQSGILGMHKIEKRPVVVNDQIVIRPMMYLALSYDHRIVDGKEAVSFLVRVKQVLEDPSLLLFNGD